MESTIIIVLQIATVTIAVASLIVSITLTKSESKKTRMVEITIKQRLEEMNNLKVCSSEFLTFINPSVIVLKDKSDYHEQLWKSYYRCTEYLKINYTIDKEILNIMQVACKKAEKYYEFQDERIKEELYSLNNVVYTKISIYTYTNWCCIKEQAYGIELKSIDYQKLYSHNEKNFL